jgi:nuclear transport factor 2 (NTF2) superfamily protein
MIAPAGFVSGGAGREFMMDLTEDEALRWLDAYSSSWVDRNADLAASLFHQDAVYQERPFSEPIRGRDAVRKYWIARVYDHQEDIEFRYELWAVRKNRCFASFRGAFTWKPINGRIEIDGVFRLAFSSVENGLPVCDSFEEWFDLKEM